MKVLTFTGIFRKEGKEYSAFCPEFEVASCGGSIEEAQKNLTEAVELSGKRKRSGYSAGYSGRSRV